MARAVYTNSFAVKRLFDWIPALSMMLVSLISYVDRNTLALLAPTILKETGLSGEQYGWIISAFSVTYMIGNPVWGRWLDRIGLTDRADDTELALGSDIMSAALDGYRFAKIAGKGTALDSLKEAMQVRLSRKPRDPGKPAA